MTDKTALRREAAARRADAHGDVDAEPARARLTRILRATVGPVSFYWPIRSEIDPRPVMEAIRADGRCVCLPVSERARPLTFREWTPGARMEADAFGVETPAEGARIVVPNVLVVPLLAFDAALHRLGYGAGHYDRTLDALRQSGEPLAIGFAYAAQEVGALPVLSTDIALDAIVTETGVRTLEANEGVIRCLAAADDGGEVGIEA